MADALDRGFSLVADRLTGGERSLSVVVAAETPLDDMTYTQLSLVRKLREFPRTQSDGFELWASALAPGALIATVEDDYNLPEGEHAYYCLFALDADAAWREKARDAQLGTVNLFDEVSGDMFPGKFLEDSGSSPQSTKVLKEAMVDVIFGDVESLIRQFALQQDAERCGLLALSLLSLEKDWPLSPVDDLENARVTLLEIKELMRTRGTEETEDILLARVAHSPVTVHRGVYYKGSVAGGDESERDWRLSALLDGVNLGGGDFQYTGTLERGPRGIRPYSVAVTISGEDYSDDGLGVMQDSTGAPFGTVDYSTGAFDITVPSTWPNVVVIYSSKVVPTTAGYAWCSDAVYSRRGFVTASSDGTEAEIMIDGYLNSESFDAALSDDIANKLRKFWSVEGKTDFLISVEAPILGSADTLVGRLPIENERGKNYAYAQRSDLVQG